MVECQIAVTLSDRLGDKTCLPSPLITPQRAGPVQWVSNPGTAQEQSRAVGGEEEGMPKF